MSLGTTPVGPVGPGMGTMETVQGSGQGGGQEEPGGVQPQPGVDEAQGLNSLPR